MSPRTLLALLAAVLALAGLAWWQVGREVRERARAEEHLFAGVQKDRVTALRIENNERDVHVRIERGPDGLWRMVDPVDVAAEQWRIEHLLDSALERTGTPVPASEADPALLGLEPPRIVLEIEEAIEGATRRERLELGHLDPDGDRVNVRVRGRLLRAWRDLDTALSRDVSGYQSHQVVHVAGRDIVEIHRRGRLGEGLGGEVVDVTLDALADGGQWRSTAPHAAALDPIGMSIWTNTLSTLQLEEYYALGERRLAEFGLDPPEVTVEAHTPRGALPRLLFGRADRSAPGGWFGKLEGDPWVWSVRGIDVANLAMPLADLVDHHLLHVVRDQVEAIELARGRETIHLVREPRRWKVGRALGPEPPAVWQAAERARVDELLSALERTEMARVIAGAAVADDEARAAVAVLAAGTRQGGRFGADADEEGERLVRYQRHGDEAIGLVERALFERVTAPYERWIDLRLVDALEVEIGRLDVAGGGAARTWLHGTRGLWTREGASEEARELRGVLDPLFFLRAERHLVEGELPPSDGREPDRRIEVTLTDRNGVPRSLALLRRSTAEGGTRVFALAEGRASRLADAVLFDRLAELLDG